MLRVSSKKALLFILNAIVLSIYYFFKPTYYGYLLSWSRAVSIYLGILLLFQLITLHFYVIKNGFFTTLFLVATYIFHFSDIFLNAIQFDLGIDTNNTVFYRQSADIIVKSTNISVLMVIFVYLGILLAQLPLVEHDNNLENNIPIAISKYEIFIITCIGLVFDLYYNLNAFIIGKKHGYIQMNYSLSGSVYINLIGYLLVTGIVLIILDQRYSNKSKNIVVLFFCIYKLLTMISGLRAYALLDIILILYIHIKKNTAYRFKVWHVIIFLLAIQVGGGIIVGIGESRLTKVDASTILSYDLDIKSNALLHMLGEFGTTQNVICEVLKRPEVVPANGSQLLESIVSIIPFIGSIFPDVNWEKMTLEGMLNIHNYGGSYLADLYFDFGPYAIFLSCTFIGVIFSIIFSSFEKQIESNNTDKVAVMAPLVVDLLFCVRSSLSKMPRMICWYFILVFLIRLIITGKANIRWRSRERNFE